MFRLTVLQKIGSKQTVLQMFGAFRFRKIGSYHAIIAEVFDRGFIGRGGGDFSAPTTEKACRAQSIINVNCNIVI